MAKGLAVITGQYPELKEATPEAILRWANELIRVLNTQAALTHPAGTGWRVENLTTEDRVIDASAESTADVRVVLTTLISDLLKSGRLGR